MAGLRVTGHGLDLGTALRGRVEDRMAATLAKYLDPHMSGSCTGHVTLRRDGAAYRTDCVLHLVTGLTLEASGAAHDVHASFEQTADKLEKRLRRYKHKLKDHGAASHNGADIEAAYAVFAAPDDEVDEDPLDAEAEEGAHPPVVAESTRTLKRQSVSEAVTALDMTGAPVVVFVHAGTGRINVVYRRSDGAIGWVDPPGERD
ncbi:MAG: ribosome-associated translation inhibitor RaiA [Methylobacteriaceae bacterium]|jgi:ribosomal subunit interface protein|uniref:Ribosome hibernation promoting factor n=3 Tax=Methylorubrum extorquens TaxID=408 RepID=C5ARD7_METEA|nr:MULTISPECIES: ribosome-associated translation inhibitor RaiA [Methylobacteriaceae]KQO86722.1 Fis family transcriptional regulator [Methylobacterium sp. Leaf90]KQO94948.1 Fis family transcriptional regulator [Methylobacterium sp. Leaf92]KQP87620.1 Fis family transcriptional regulator [Methylobacterium sp. Leaf119]KQP99133.1 Fis family transcriptional regulator [Methylobacterium sp. Leaf121]MBA9066587.1 ribosomal subunit interface protein [Methylobacterium sp. RAS18]MDF9865286.1 ribosomal su